MPKARSSKDQLPLVVAVAGDAGGAQAMVPVIELLIEEGRVGLIAWAYRQAIQVWSRAGISYEELREDLGMLECKNLLNQVGAELVCLATSHNGIDLEKLFLAAARMQGIPSLSLLDYWRNLKVRFCDDSGKLSPLPDRIAVMDELTRERLIAEGFNPKALTVTGQPAFDELASWGESQIKETRARYRELLQIGQDHLLILFASQPFRGLYAEGHSNNLEPLGYDEYQVIEALIDALDDIGKESGREIVLLIRPHPRESIEPLQKWSARNIKVLVAREGNHREAIMAADVVTGMNSVLLVESCYLGQITVSLQPGLLGSDGLPTNQDGISIGVYQKADFKRVLAKFALDEEARQRQKGKLKSFRPAGNAARKVAEEIYELMGRRG